MRMPGDMGTRTLSSAVTYQPIWIGRTVTVDRIACRSIVTSSVVGTQNGRLGIYNDSNGKPGTLKIDAGGFTFTSATGTATHSINITQSLDAGWYWLACSVGAGATWRGFTAYGNNYWMPSQIGDPSSDSIVMAYFSNTDRSGGFPATADSATPTGHSSQAVWIRV
jgi:hypothetical protein